MAILISFGMVMGHNYFCKVFEKQVDGTLVKDRQWHIDRFGIVRETDPIPDDVVPEWVQPTARNIETWLRTP